MFGNPHQDDSLHHFCNSWQQVNHTPALHNVIKGFVYLLYKYNLSRVPVRNVVCQTVVDKPFQTIKFLLPPVFYEEVLNVIKTRTGISWAPVDRRSQLGGRVYLNSRWRPWLLITRARLGSDEVANITMATNKSTFRVTSAKRIGSHSAHPGAS